MALQINYTKDEINYPEAYAHIVYVRSEADTTYIFVNWFKTRQERIDSIKPAKREDMHKRPKAFKGIEYLVPTKDYPAGSIWPKAYEYIKSLPEFAGAIDIIDPITVEEQPVVVEPEPQPVVEEYIPTQPEAQA
jgi:hypothetical protein